MQPPVGIEDLPSRVRLFPLAGAILLPRALVPLNIFEPRYLALTRDAMAADQLIALVQPREPEGPLFEVGGVGRIVRYAETGDGRLLIALQGLSRFRLIREIPATTPYRQAEVDHRPFVDDWTLPPPLGPERRERLRAALSAFLDRQGLAADWDAVEGADDEHLVHTLASVCPFDTLERQALIEAADLVARAETLIALMALAGGPVPVTRQ